MALRGLSAPLRPPDATLFQGHICNQVSDFARQQLPRDSLVSLVQTNFDGPGLVLVRSSIDWISDPLT